MTTSSLLIEIFTEELPFSAIKKELNNILPKFKKNLAKYSLDCDVNFFYTPRRLIFYSKDFPLRQPDVLQEFFGPPLSIAYDNGEPTNALLSFIKKINVSKDSLKTAKKDGKECLYYSCEEKGKESTTLIEKIILEFLESLNFGKSMQWGNVESSFIRPIRNIFVLINQKYIKLEKLENKYQFKQSDIILAHRSFEGKMIDDSDQYFAFLESYCVIYSQDERKERILSAIKSHNEIKVEIDSDLLDEIVAICEYPSVMVGRFDKKFLELPKEVIVTSMKVNQKYFATYKDDNFNKLDNAFVVVCNTTTSNEVVLNGNIKVLTARLEDALFFYHNDLKTFKQNSCDERLGNIEFIAGCGNLKDKVSREKNIAKVIAKTANEESLAIIIDSIEISKNDLLSEMVGEFGELQGIMGSYYTNDERLKIPLKEQYLPLQENGKLPNSFEGGIVAIANKLDSILCLFAIDKIPSGSKDPFALRRAASGIIKIIEKFNINFNLDEILEALKPLYKNIDIEKIKRFFYERLEGVLNVNQSLINAALSSKQSDILKLLEQIKALELVAKSSDRQAYKALFKRVANILTTEVNGNINPQLLQQQEEKELYNKIESYKSLTIDSADKRIKELLDFKDVLEKFFDNVMINIENKALMENRILLIKFIYEEFFKVGDVKEISF